jgi:hypothetical protein
MFSVFNSSRVSGGTRGCNRRDVIGVPVTSEEREPFCHVKKRSHYINSASVLYAVKHFTSNFDAILSPLWE